MDIEQLVEEKRQLEQDIIASVSGLVDSFRDKCGASPSSIALNMQKVERIGEKFPSYYVNGAHVHIDI